MTIIRRWIVLALLFAGIVVSYVDRGNLSIAAVPIMNELGAAPTTMGTLLSCFFWTYSVFQIPSGMLVDRYSTRRIYAAAFVVWSIASAGVGLSRTFSAILICRLVLGAAESVGPVASLAYIRTSFSEKEQGAPTAVYVAGLTVGPAVGTLLGSYALASFGWRWLFVLTGLGALIWLVPWLALARDGTARQDRDLSQPPTPWKMALRQPGLWVLTVSISLFSYCWVFVVTWVPSYLLLVHKFSMTEMGRVFSIPMFVMALVSVIAGSVADRVIRRTGRAFAVRLWFCAAGLAGTGCLLFLIAIPDRSWVSPVLLVSFSAMGVASSSFWALAQLAAPAQVIGRGLGYLNMVAQMVGAAAPIITGWLLGPQKHFTIALAAAGICPLLASLILLRAGSGRFESLRAALCSEVAVGEVR